MGKTTCIYLKQHHPAILLIVINAKESEMNTMCKYVCMDLLECAQVHVHMHGLALKAAGRNK